MCNTIDPGEGYRLLRAGEAILSGDEFHRETWSGWNPVITVVGQRYDCEEHYPTRRRIDAHPLPVEQSRAFQVGDVVRVARKVSARGCSWVTGMDSYLGTTGVVSFATPDRCDLTECYYSFPNAALDIVTPAATEEPTAFGKLREQVDAMTAERDELRQKLATAQSDNSIIRNANVNLQSDLDAASNALRSYGCAQGEIDDDIAQCIHDLATRWRTETEQRACEVVMQMCQRGMLEISDIDNIWFVPFRSDYWRCRPAQPKPVTKAVALPPDKWPDIEAAIKAAGGRV